MQKKLLLTMILLLMLGGCGQITPADDQDIPEDHSSLFGESLSTYGVPTDPRYYYNSSPLPVDSVSFNDFAYLKAYRQHGIPLDAYYPPAVQLEGEWKYYLDLINEEDFYCHDVGIARITMDHDEGYVTLDLEPAFGEVNSRLSDINSEYPLLKGKRYDLDYYIEVYAEIGMPGIFLTDYYVSGKTEYIIARFVFDVDSVSPLYMTRSVGASPLLTNQIGG